MLAYDDTTFYAKLVSGEAVLVQAWDGWCNYGIAENAKIKFVVPKEGSDMWVDTMVVMAASENKDAAYEFVNFILEADNHRWAAENILYKVPNEPAMAGVDPSLIETFPNMGMTPADMLKFEQLRDVGEAQRDYSRIVSEIKRGQLTVPRSAPDQIDRGRLRLPRPSARGGGQGPVNVHRREDPCFLMAPRSCG